MLGTEIGIHEVRTNLNLFSGIVSRPFKKNILFQENENLFYQLKEKRTNFYVGINKNFNIAKISQTNNLGLSLGIKGLYSFGDYAGVYKIIDTNFLYAPFVGCFVKGKYFGAGINYEYLKLNTSQSPHRINLNCSINLRILKLNYLKKTLFWF